jgi:precorrin-4 methylase
MAEPPPPIQFEDVTLDQARRMSRGPRMDPKLYHALKEKIQSLDDTATRLMVPEGTRVTTMKARILRMAAELGIPVTIRRVPGGIIFWRSTDEDIQQAQETASRLQTAQRRPQARPRGRRPRGTR